MRDSSEHDEEETSDFPMEQIHHDRSTTPNPEENAGMIVEQAGEQEATTPPLKLTPKSMPVTCD